MYTTRSGRVVKAPERYEPVEEVNDDFSDSDVDSHWESDISSEISYDQDDIDEETDSDDSIADFVVQENDEIKKDNDDNDNGCDDDSVVISTDSDSDE